MESVKPIRNQFDNDISITYKWAKYLNIPQKYVLKINENTYTNVIDEINNQLAIGKSLTEISDLFPNISTLDLAMIYTLIESKKISIKEILKNINNWYIMIDLKPIRDENELKFLYNDWSKKYKKSWDQDLDKLDRILDVQEELSEYAPLNKSPINIEQVTLSIRFSINGKDVIPEDGIVIFNNVVPDKYISYIQYKGETDNLYKLFTGKTIEERPNYENVIPIEQKISSNSFLFTVWSGKEGDNIKNATKDSYLKAEYDLSKNSVQSRSAA